MLHSVLQRQLRRLGLSERDPPPSAAWSAFLDRVDAAYRSADDDRYIIERSLEISSLEMRDLHLRLARERDTLHTVLEALSDAVVHTDEALRVHLVNAAGCRLLGVGRAEVRGLSLLEVWPLTGGRATGGAWPLDALRGGACVVLEDATLHRPDGGTVPVAVRFSPILEAGALVGVVVVLRDISEDKALRERLMEASRLSGMAEVATGILHNLGNALTSVDVASQTLGRRRLSRTIDSLQRVVDLMAREVPGDSEAGRHADRGPLIGRLLAEIVRALRADDDATAKAHARISAGMEHMRLIVATQQSYARVGGLRRVLDPNQVVRDALVLEEQSLTRHGIVVVEDFGDLGTCAVDAGRLVQIVGNLLRNAKDAIVSAAPPDRSLRVTTRRLAEQLTISVTDHGLGMTPEQAQRVFEHGFTTKDDGNGFGLHISAVAATEMGGRLEGASEGPGRGATFTITLPVRAGERARAAG